MEIREILRRFLRNAALFLGSRLVFGLLNLASSALVVRFYGLGELGVVVLLQAYVRLFSEVVKFESWQAVLTYGTRPFDADRAAFKRLLGLTLGIDIVSLAIGIACGLAFMPWAVEIFEWPPEVARFAPFFLLSLPFITQGTPNGVLRLVDRVDILAWQHGLNATVRFAGVLLVWATDGGVLGLVLAWFAGSILAGMLQWAYAFRELAIRRMKPRMRLNLRDAAREFPGIWRFLALSNATSSLGLVYNAGTTMILGASLGASAAATLQIAQQLVNAISKPARQLGPIIAPEFTRLAAGGDWGTFRDLLVKQMKLTALVVGGIGTVLFVLLGPLLAAVYGEALLENIWLFRILIFNALLASVFFSVVPAFLSVAKAGTVLTINAVSAVIYMVVTFALLEAHGLLAVGYGVIASTLISLPLNVILGGRLLRKRLRRVGEAAR